MKKKLVIWFRSPRFLKDFFQEAQLNSFVLGGILEKVVRGVL